MGAIISVVQDYGVSYSGYASEVAKNVFYLIDVSDGILSRTTNPLRRPEAGSIFSYEVYLRCRLDSPPVTRCYNFKAWYDSGMPAVGQTLKVNSDKVISYVAPVDSESVRGTRVDFTTKNAEGNSIALNGNMTAIGNYSSYLVFQLEIFSTAVLSENSVDMVIQYDEV